MHNEYICKVNKSQFHFKILFNKVSDCKIGDNNCDVIHRSYFLPSQIAAMCTLYTDSCIMRAFFPTS